MNLKKLNIENKKIRDLIPQALTILALLSVVIYLSNIDFIDSSGLGAMVQAAKTCTQSKRQFSVVGNPRVIQTIKLVRLEDFLHLAPDLNTAISNLSA